MREKSENYKTRLDLLNLIDYSILTIQAVIQTNHTIPYNYIQFVPIKRPIIKLIRYLHH